jgi:ribosomal protein L11 methylase PrmA
MSYLSSSFRDPAGFLFRHKGRLYRQINPPGAADWKLFQDSGLASELIEKELLIPHEEADRSLGPDGRAEAVICPEEIPFLSWPYEWSFSQLKDAALLTLELQSRALDKGMILKDASAYNVQFRKGRPVFIDSLSFTAYQEGEPWAAYGQFCSHFLAPLALMSHTDIGLQKLLRTDIGGISLELASRLLPWKTRFSFGLLSHIHLHANSQKRHAGRGEKTKARLSKFALKGVVESLRSAVNKCTWNPEGMEWTDYYDATNYSDDSFSQKKEIVSRYLKQAEPGLVWDLGANTGVFSRLASSMGATTVSWDIDPTCVEQNYRQVRRAGESLLPLVQDLVNPSPSLGWDLTERESLQDRGPADLVMALALVHHLAISNNVPLERLAAFFAKICRSLIIEWVPKQDSQVELLLATREDIFPEYHQEGFEAAFGKHFVLEISTDVGGSQRTLYLMQNRHNFG